MASFALWTTAAVAAVSLAAAVTQPSPALTGVAVAPGSSTTTTTSTTSTGVAPVTVVTTPSPAPPPQQRPPRTPASTAPPRSAAPAPPVTSAQPPTTAAPRPSAASSRESCGWSWDATHFDDGSRNEVTLYLDAPRRPATPVTITVTPGASAPIRFDTATDADGQASVVVSLSNDKRDWSVSIAAQFPSSRCDPRSFTITY